MYRNSHDVSSGDLLNWYRGISHWDYALKIQTTHIEVWMRYARIISNDQREIHDMKDTPDTQDKIATKTYSAS